MGQGGYDGGFLMLAMDTEVVCPPLPGCPQLSQLFPGAILTAGEGDAGQGLSAEHGSGDHHTTEQAESSGHGGGQRGRPPGGSCHHPCGEGEGEGTLCVSLHPAETRQGKKHPAQVGDGGAPEPRATRGPPVWARTSYCCTGRQRLSPSPCRAPAPKSLAQLESSPPHPLGLLRRDAEVSRCSCLCPQSLRAHPHQEFLWFHHLSEHPQNGRGGTT